MLKSRKEDADASSPFSRLPDEIFHEIINKIIDLKSLCFCYLVSRRFSSIVLQVDAIAFTGESFASAINFFIMFKGLKYVCIELPSIDNGFLFKWTVKFGSSIESLICLLPDSVCDKDGVYLYGNGDEEEDDIGLIHEFCGLKHQISSMCLEEAILWHMMLLYLVKYLPMLEEVSITDSGKRGRLSLSGKKLIEVKEWVHSTSASEIERNRIEDPDIVRYCYIPVLKLPVSGYVMKGVTFFVMEMKDHQGEYDSFMNSEDGGFEDKDEAALYTEAVKEIFEKMRRLHT
ncbi:unnamed protein product [Lactuca saligna]|uniref:F-box domain-containing protein n=1 Tax=Lactuca saligna TaxID=75948 RepID=A0AA35YPE5_LACSI|nr:unnamed protein product [Lactuca saligna]